MNNNNYITYKSVQLIPYEEKYFEYIYSCYQDYNSRYLFTNEMVINSKQYMWEYINDKIKSIYHEFMIIINNSTNLPIGFIYSYNYNVYNEYLYVAIFIQGESRNTVFGAEAGAAFFEYLFKHYPIRKVYCTVYDYNKNSIKFLKNAGFNTEGVLKKHRYFNGNYHNMNIMSLYRDDLYKILERLKYKK